VAKLPSNLPDILRKHGLKVVEIAGWRDRGVDGSFNPVGVLCHHTAGHDDIGDPADDLAYVKNVLVKGRADLRGPLCQLALSAEGVVYIVAAGRANHAGNAKASGTVSPGNGNTLYIGIEAMNAGTGRDNWEKSQYEAYVLLCAVLSVEVTGNSVQTVRAHKETSVTGKIDPAGPIAYLNEKTFDMGKFRARVAAKMVDIKRPPAPAPKPVESHTRWAVRKTGVHDAPNGKRLRDIPAGYSFSVVDGSGHGNDGWVKTTHGNWVLGKDTTTVKPGTKKLVKVMTWNAENKGAADGKLDRAEVIELLGERQPHYFAGQELYNVDLSDIPGYQTYQAWEGYSSASENRAQAILVRNDVALKVSKALPMEEEWVGPKMGIKKEPRVHRYVVGNKYETNIPVGTFHVPFGKDSVQETKLATIEWLKEMKAAHGVAFAVGDWNSLAADLQALVGTPAGAKVDGGGKDKILFLGAKLVDSANLGTRGRSDHPVKEWTFEVLV
jgi:hypothetical protein